MSKVSSRLVGAAIMGFACILAPGETSAEAPGTVLCSVGAGNDAICKVGSATIARAQRGILPRQQNFVQLQVNTRQACQVRCNFNIQWSGGGESFQSVPPGTYSHDIPKAASLLQLLCYCQ